MVNAQAHPNHSRGPAAPAKAAELSRVPRADPNGTMLALGGLLFTLLLLRGNSASEVAHTAAIGVGLSLCLSVAADAQRGLSNLIRADLMAVLAFYGLTLFEFFFPHPEFDQMIDKEGAVIAIRLCIIAFAGLLIGRHWSRKDDQPMEPTMTRPVSNLVMLSLFWGCLALGFWHMFISVQFDFDKVIEHMMGPRFTQPWGRGRLGDWKALLVELAMLLFLVPPLAGIIFARRRLYNIINLLLVAAGLAFLLFYGFTTGTRYLFHSFLITFVIGYAFGAERNENRIILITLAALALAMMVASTVVMLRFREAGLRNYLLGKSWQTEPVEKSLSVDLNLYSIASLIRVFPDRHDYIGLEVPYLAIIRPIPRAVWPSKPEGMSFSIEDAVGAQGWTVAATFAGEAYMSGGYLAVIGCSLFFGFITAWWNRLSSDKNSQFGVLIYASGFFAAVISMRSIFFSTTALLPTLAAMVGARFLFGKGADKLHEITQRNAAPRPRPRPGPRPRGPLPVR